VVPTGVVREVAARSMTSPKKAMAGKIGAAGTDPQAGVGQGGLRRRAQRGCVAWSAVVPLAEKAIFVVPSATRSAAALVQPATHSRARLRGSS